MALPLAPAAAVIKVGGNLFGSYDKEKDANRRAGNTKAYGLAAAGSRAAYDYLRARSGKVGTINVPPIGAPLNFAGGATAGWASKPARDDANAKAKSLASMYESVLQPVPQPITGAVVDPAAPEQRAVVQQAGMFGGLPTWAVGLIAAGIIIAVMRGTKGA